MAEYQRNHTIPRSILEFWVDPLRKGVHVHDIRNKRSYVSGGHGSSRFSFAFVNDLHIPVENGRRLVGLEKWFGELEASLVHFARQAHAKKVPIVFNRNVDVTKTVMALLGIECRSRYNIEMIQRALEKNEALRHLLSGSDTSTAKKTTLENLIQLVTEQVEYVTPPEFFIFHAPKGKSWLISDRPFFKFNIGFRAVVLTNKVIVAYRRSEDDALKHAYFDVDDDKVDDFNKEIALNARDWIVAENSELLADYATVTKTDEWEQRKAEDHIASLPIKFSTSGFAITR
jgi:Protein of unknown function (DUF4238)